MTPFDSHSPLGIDYPARVGTQSPRMPSAELLVRTALHLAWIETFRNDPTRDLIPIDRVSIAVLLPNEPNRVISPAPTLSRWSPIVVTDCREGD